MQERPWTKDRDATLALRGAKVEFHPENGAKAKIGTFEILEMSDKRLWMEIHVVTKLTPTEKRADTFRLKQVHLNAIVKHPDPSIAEYLIPVI
jgi:hypothetical protein